MGLSEGATDETLGTAPRMGAEETRHAIEAADRASSAWRGKTAEALEDGIVGINEGLISARRCGRARKRFCLPAISPRHMIARITSSGGNAMIRLTLSLLMVLLAVSNAFAGERSRGFSNSDIKGAYGLLAQGTSAVPGTPIAFPAIYIGQVVSDGNGNLQGMGTINPGGPISGLQPGQPVMLTGTYDIDADGTGDVTGSGTGGSPSATSNSRLLPP